MDYEHTDGHVDCVGPGCWEKRLAAAGGPVEINPLAVELAKMRGLVDQADDGTTSLRFDRLNDRLDPALVEAAEDKRATFRAAQGGPVWTWRRTLADAANFAREHLGMTRAQIASWLGCEPHHVDHALGSVPDDAKAHALSLLQRGCSYREAAKGAGMDERTVARLGKRHGIKRTRSNLPPEVSRDIDLFIADGHSPAKVVELVLAAHGSAAECVSRNLVKQRSHKAKAAKPQAVFA